MLNQNSNNTREYNQDFNEDLNKLILLNKEIFIAEYNSLRGEIQQRISQQTTINQIAITAWGAIISYALGKIDASNSYNNISLVLAYPLLAYFISFGWAFNNTRVCQLAQYLRMREKQASRNFALLGWENYVDDIDTKNKTAKSTRPISLLYRLINLLQPLFESAIGTNKVKPGITILVGTQLLSVILGIILIIACSYFQTGFYALIAIDGLVISFTILTLSRSGKWKINSE